MATKPKSKRNKRASSASRRAKITAAERVRLGPEVAEIKAGLPRSQWKQIVRDAHKRGFSVAGALSGNPDPLKERTTSSLRKEADELVGRAYKPQSAELDFAQRRLEGMNEKRQRDDAMYNQWLMQKTSEAQAAQLAAQQKYEAFTQAQAARVEQEAGARAQAAQQRAQGAASSDLSGSIAFAGMNERAKSEAERARAQATQAVAQGPISATIGTALGQAAIGQGQAANARREGDYGKASGEIRAARLKLTSDQALASIQQYTRLLDKEMDKASANRDFGGLMAQLDVKRADQANEMRQFTLGLKAKEEQSRRSAATTRRGQTLTARERAADRRARQREGSRDRELRRELAAAKGAGGVKGEANSQKQVSAIRSISGYIQSEQAGRLRDPDTGKMAPTRSVLRKMGASEDQINIAKQLARGKLDARGIRRARALGILDPSLLR